jgi:ketosteroid isomerase-like protein
METNMSNATNTATATVGEFFRALAIRDIALADAVLDDHVVETVPYSLSGSPDPQQIFEGKQAVLDYLKLILDNFENAEIEDVETFVSGDAETVFVEAKGRLIVKHTSQLYRNTYVFRFNLKNGKITHIREYANPVTYAKAMGQPLG